MSDFDYDLFVIGGGSGGVRAARVASGFGQSCNCRGVSLRRDLRDPRLCTKKTVRLCLTFW